LAVRAVISSRTLAAPCILFFRSCPVAHRVPHSFPTRRSSDLGEHLNHLPAVGPRVHHHGAPQGAGDAVGELQAGETPAQGGHGQDRKSTRLNSSHVSISYAVFCLKKKK